MVIHITLTQYNSGRMPIWADDSKALTGQAAAGKHLPLFTHMATWYYYLVMSNGQREVSNVSSTPLPQVQAAAHVPAPSLMHVSSGCLPARTLVAAFSTVDDDGSDMEVT